MAVSNFLRPELPYDYESLQNSNRYQLITADGAPPPPLMLDSEFNYLVSAVRTLDVAMNGLAIGIIPGANDPNNAGLFPTTDGSSNISWVRVSGPYIQDNSVPGSKLFAGTITSREIGDGTILSTKYGPKSIPTTALNDSIVTTNKLVDRNTTRQKIALKAIGNDELDDDAVQERNILDQNVTRQKISLKAIGNDQLDDNAVQTRNILDANVTESKILDGSVTTNKVPNKSVPVSKINSEASSAGSVMISDGAGGAIWTNNARVLQVVSATTNATTSTNVVFPYNSIPTNTSGVEMITCQITPKSSSSTLYIRWYGLFGTQGQIANIFLGTGLFQDNIVNALSSQYINNVPNVSSLYQSILEHKMTSGTTSPTTFKIRVGADNGSTFALNTYNGSSAAGGGTTFSKLEIWEIAS